MKQSGLLIKRDVRDYILGASPIPHEDLMPSRDWREYLPKREKQSYSFDTFCCTTFSALNVIETQMNFLMNKIPVSKVKELNDLGYIVDGEINLSDRFTAIMSGTMANGNYFQAVWDSIRKDGLLPEKDLPFGGKNQVEYLDKSKITQAMKTKAKKILDIFDFFYEQSYFLPEGLGLGEAIKHAPLQGAIPVPGSHAVALPTPNYIFDTYEPFLYERTLPLHYFLKGVVKLKNPEYKYFSKKEVEKFKLKPALWQLLDKLREECGFPFIINSGLRTEAENNALKDSVSDSAHLSGLAVDLAITDSLKRFKLIEVALKNGVKRIGVGKTFVHIDVADDKPQNVVWHYY
jgi:hypothetical protein